MSGAYKKIGEAQRALLRRDGPAAVQWQRRVGLAKASALCIGLVISGIVPFVGLFALGWTPAAMLLFMAIDVLAVLLGDAVKLLLAPAAVRHTHAQDHRTQQVLGIVGGMEDGTGTYTDHGKGLSPRGLWGIALVCSFFLVPVMAAALEPMGLGTLRAAIEAPWFREVAISSLLVHLGQSAWAAQSARRQAAEDRALFLDAGGIVGLFAGLLVLVWLPLIWGSPGVIALLVVLFLFRLGFGVFALYWMPRVTRALERQLAEGGR